MSISCLIVIARYMNSELTVDSSHRNKDRICATVMQSETGTENGIRAVWNPEKLEINMLNDPAVLASTITFREESTFSLDKHEFTASVLRVDTSFQKIFDFPVVKGKQQIASSKSEAAITERYARKIFGDEEPLGKTLTINSKLLTITSVVGDIESKSSITFDIITHYYYYDTFNGSSTGWVFMAPNQSIEQFNARYTKYFKVYSNQNTRYRYQLMSLDDLYFDNSVDKRGFIRHGDKSTLGILFIVALSVLLVGLFNFVNIYTVLMLRRSREMGVKKVFGASAVSIARGLYVENLVMVALAVGGGWLMSQMSDDLVAAKLGIDTVPNLRFDIALSVAFLIVIPLLTSIYPYLKFRYAQPITSLKSIASSGKSIVSRAILLVLQYVMTIVLIIVSIYFVRQLNFMLDSDLGYNPKGIIKVRMFTPQPNGLSEEESEKYETDFARREQFVRAQLNSSPLIMAWAYTESPNTASPGYGGFSVGGSEFVNTQTLYCAEADMKLFDLKLKEGRWWKDTVDTFKSYNMIVNETFLKKFGINDYSTAVVQPEERQWTVLNGSANDELMKLNPPYRIIGVVKDFHTGHLRQPIDPLVILCNFDDDGNTNAQWSELCASAVPGKEVQAIELLGKIHAEVGNGDFRYTMLEDEIAAMYTEDRRVTTIYSVFAVIAIMIGCLGLFSLSLYDVQQRYREIALRRVNGARVGQITVMLLRKYYLLLSLAFVIAAPTAWWAIDAYMSDFATRAPLSWWIFALAAIVTAAISLLTLMYQTVKAAHTNPTVAMKTE